MSATKHCAMCFHLYQTFFKKLFCNALFAVGCNVNALTRCFVEATSLKVVNSSGSFRHNSFSSLDVGNNVSGFDIPKTCIGSRIPRHNALAVASKVQSIERSICRSDTYQCAKTIG